jgi:ATP-dependent DNA helicase RecQ
MQVNGLRHRGVRAELMCSAQTDASVHLRARNGEFDVLYMTPERACNLTQR